MRYLKFVLLIAPVSRTVFRGSFSERLAVFESNRAARRAHEFMGLAAALYASCRLGSL